MPLAPTPEKLIKGAARDHRLWNIDQLEIQFQIFNLISIEEKNLLGRRFLQSRDSRL